ncbi:unnamed protein product [Cochlearia groenlandica]
MSSSSPEDSCIKFDAFGHVVKKPVEEAMATKASVIDEFTSLFENLSAPEDYLQYVINGIHELTGFNWWISIVLTAFLVNGLMSPINLLIQRQIWELRAVYFYLVSFRIFIYTLFINVNERVVSLMREFINVVNKKGKK